MEDRLFDWLIIDPNPIERIAVVDNPLAIDLGKFCMHTRDGHIGEHDATLRRATQLH